MRETFETLQQSNLWDTSTFTSSPGSGASPSAWHEQDTPNASAHLQEVFPVKISATQANKQVSPANGADSGKSNTVSFRSRLIAGVDLITSSLRTLQHSLDGGLTPFLSTLPKQGTMRDGQLYERQISAHHTDANESSSWRTPTAGDSHPSGTGYQPGRTIQLSHQVQREWPTFLASEATHGGPNQRRSDGTPTLTNLARQNWPTPQSRDYRSGDTPDSPRAIRKAEQGFSPNLNDAVNWPTPTANDAKNATLPPSQESRDGIAGTSERTGYQGTLNPDWVEMLQGYPVGWTDIDGLLDQDNHNTSTSRPESSQNAARTA